MSLVNDLELEVENFKREYEKFERGNKSAGTRARKVLQDIKKTCQEIRVSIQGAKKEEEKAEPASADWPWVGKIYLDETNFSTFSPLFGHFLRKAFD